MSQSIEGLAVLDWEARKAATVSGLAGRAETPLPSHQTVKIRKSVP
jgi:hypothetical protein